jgi:hypothetical protein
MNSNVCQHVRAEVIEMSPGRLINLDQRRQKTSQQTVFLQFIFARSKACAVVLHRIYGKKNVLVVQVHDPCNWRTWIAA